MKIFTKILILSVLAVLIVISGLYFIKNIAPAKKTIAVVSQNIQPKPVSQVCFRANCFAVELAMTSAQQEQGLMNRTSLDKSKGMLFIFPNSGEHLFWMKDTLIPLDMIWMDQNYKVVFVGQNEQPCPPSLVGAGKTIICPIIDPKANAKYVLEINAGITNNLGIKINSLAVAN